MCNGSIMDKLISFALPLMVSSILQLMFNAVDIIVIGRFSGSQSLAAVGSTTALIAVFTNLFIGISLGANVLAARFYAAGRHKEMSETVHTAITLALISGILMAVIGQLFARSALELMATPDDVINLSSLYLRIYFLGMPFFMLYNYGAAILRAVGDTKRPLFFLIISGSVNAILNLLLVIVFHLDVAGVAISTVIAQMKGKSTAENIERNFGMPEPEGYRKALRLMKQAEKFHRPIICFVDTPGAYPGKEAEEKVQAQAIADCLYTFSSLKTPVLCFVLSEGGSGGALALSVADKIFMLEYAVYSILSPEGFASISVKVSAFMSTDAR